jgi:hypothetical protein
VGWDCPELRVHGDLDVEKVMHERSADSKAGVERSRTFSMRLRGFNHGWTLGATFNISRTPAPQHL